MVPLLWLAACLTVSVLLRRFLYEPKDRTLEDYRGVMFFVTLIWFVLYLFGVWN